MLMEINVKNFMNTQQLLTKNATVLIGTSGGPDSMALLHFFVSVKEEWNLRLVALSVDHQLRGAESREDVHYVKKMCEQWGVEVITKAIDVRAYQKKHKVSTQIAARKLRYQFFLEQMNDLNAQYLALGHHGDDQIETMLMTITRSASSSSLLGIPVKRPFGSGYIIRPFLTVTKAQILAYCRQHQIQPRFDPSNLNIDDTRVYFRKKVIPIIKQKNDNIHTTIQHLSETLHEDEDFLQIEANKLIKRIVKYKNNGQFASFHIDQFKSYAPALQRRVFHLILNYLYGGKLPKSLSYVHETSFLALMKEQHGTVKINFPNELIVEQSYGTISFYFHEKEIDNRYQKQIVIPGETTLPDGSKLITQIVSEQKRNVGKYTYLCAKEAVALPLHIRTRRAGDRMSWHGLNGRKKLKDIFIDEKVPRDKRDSWPLVVDDQGELLWAIGIKKGLPSNTVKSTSWIQLQFEK